ncbi:hypothetical protein [Xanthobacter versatilis]|uniref:hypothetical protein n=1 Tax=Xanthobacter autotrophicus (strain ATCC BAA-1158 / Py2) TaxID=78245 RepID=UPI00372C74D1
MNAVTAPAASDLLDALSALELADTIYLRLTAIEMMGQGLKHLAEPDFGAAFSEVAQDTARYAAALRAKIFTAEARSQP